MGTTPGTGKQALSAHCLKAMEAHQLDQLSEARAEFAQFAGYMGMGKQGGQQGASAAKWAKGEAKGEPKQEPDFSSKGLGAASLTTPSREGQMVLGRRRRHAGPGSGKQTRSGGQRRATARPKEPTGTVRVGTETGQAAKTIAATRRRGWRSGTPSAWRRWTGNS